MGCRTCKKLKVFNVYIVNDFEANVFLIYIINQILIYIIKQFDYNQIKINFFIIFAVLRRRVKPVCSVHLRLIAPVDKQLHSTKCCSGGESLATLCPT